MTVAYVVIQAVALRALGGKIGFAGCFIGTLVTILRPTVRMKYFFLVKTNAYCK